MTNPEILAKAIMDVDMVIAKYLQPGHQQDPVRALEDILLIMDHAKVVEVAERVLAGFTGPYLVK